MAFITVILPIGVLIFSRGIGAIYWAPILIAYPVWATPLIAVAGTVGVAFGASRSMEIYGHLLGLESPKRPTVTFLLWLTLLMIGLVSYYLFGAHHAL